MELAWRIWGKRRRQNTALRTIASMVSTMMQPHVSRSDRHAVAPDVLFVRIARGELDEDEVLR